MRIIFFAIAAILVNIFSGQISYSQSKPTINAVDKKSYNDADISCASANDAELTVYATGGTGKLEYSIDNGNTYQSGNVFSGLEAGITYAIFVRDAKKVVSNGKWVYVKEPNPVTLTGIQKDYRYNGNNDVTCFGSSDGQITISAWGGTGTLKYSADNGATYQNSKVIKGLAAGTYQVIVKDDNGCTASSSVTLVNPEPVSATSQISMVCGAATGSVTVTGDGGVGNYRYSLDGGSFKWSGAFTNISAGEHHVQVRDNNGCTAVVPVTLTSSYSAAISGSDIVCSGSTSNFTINISGGNGDVFTVVYKNETGSNYTVNNLAAGENKITTQALTASATFTLVSVKNQSGCAGSLSGAANITVASPGQWLGVNNDWNDAANWSCGSIPTGGVNVTIPATRNNPVIAGSAVGVKDIAIANGASLTINGTLQVSGAIINQGNLDVTSGTLEMKGNTPQTISGSWFVRRIVRNLKISNSAGLNLSATANDTLNITGILSFGVSNAIFNTKDNLTLKSTAEGTASVADLTNDGANKGNAIIGDVVVERYINIGPLPGQHNKSWVMVSTPTKGQSIKQSWMENGDKTSTGYGTQIIGNGVGFDMASGSPSLKYYDDEHNVWIGVTNTTLPVYNQNGYMLFVRGDRSAVFPNYNNTTLRTKGTLLTGAQPAIKVKAGKFQSVGNPYASDVDIRKITTEGVSPDIIIWDATLTTGSVYGLGAYQTLYRMGDNYVNLLPSPAYGPAGTINNFIKSGLSFFVQASGTDGELTFTERSKSSAAGSGIAMRKGSADENGMSVTARLLGISGDGSAFSIDGAVLQFSEEYSNEVNNMDTRKIANSSESLSIRSGGKDLTIERRSKITSGDTICYNLADLRNQNYRFELDAAGLQNTEVQGFVEDHFTGTQTILNPEGATTIDFTVTNAPESRAANRFSVVFRTYAPLPVNITSIKAMQKNNNASVEWKVENQSKMQRYEIEKSTDGHQFTIAASVPANNSASAAYNWLDQHAGTGYIYYRIQCIDVNGKANYSQIVKIQMSAISSSISVYPNPAVNATVTLQLTNQPAGIYYTRLINPLGQVVMSKQIVHKQGNSAEIIKWSNQSARGHYQLEITKPDGSSETIRILY